MALGAERTDVLRGIAGQGLRVTMVGVAAGIAGGVACLCVSSPVSFSASSRAIQPRSWVCLLILIAVALLACYLPARRATKVDPMVALRYE